MTPPPFLTKSHFDAIDASEIGDPRRSGRPLVSVLMIAYNQAPYISQAIESIVAQRCEFEFELVIGEDCSQDETRKICQDYQRSYSGIIRLISSEMNVGMHRNLARIWHRARGRYIALCEGDDYWTAREKLAKQATWMQSRPGFTLCGAYTQKIKMDESDSWQSAGIVGPREVKSRYGIRDLIRDYSFHTSSAMIRKDAVRFPGWLWDQYCADRPLYLLCAEAGDVGFIPEVMSVYRMHAGGIWVPIRYGDKARKGIALFEALDRHFNRRYHTLIEESVSSIVWSYMAEAMAARDPVTARRLFWLAIKHRLGAGRMPEVRPSISTMLQLYAPKSYHTMRKIHGFCGSRMP